MAEESSAGAEPPAEAGSKAQEKEKSVEFTSFQVNYFRTVSVLVLCWLLADNARGIHALWILLTAVFSMKVFNLFDPRRKGFIPTDQVGEVLQNLGQTPTRAELKDLIKEAVSYVSYEGRVRVSRRWGGMSEDGGALRPCCVSMSFLRRMIRDCASGG
jgi:hypothetical protein